MSVNSRPAAPAREPPHAWSWYLEPQATVYRLANGTALLVGLGFVPAGALVALLFLPARPAPAVSEPQTKLKPPTGGTLIGPSTIHAIYIDAEVRIAWVYARPSLPATSAPIKTREQL
jgi:hypothetical protein